MWMPLLDHEARMGTWNPQKMDQGVIDLSSPASVLCASFADKVHKALAVALVKSGPYSFDGTANMLFPLML